MLILEYIERNGDKEIIYEDRFEEWVQKKT